MNKPQWFLDNAPTEPLPENSQNTGGNLLIRAWHDIRFHIASFLFKWKFPHYRTHRPDSPLAEYWGFIRRIPMVHFYYNRVCDQKINALLNEKTPFYLLPLQLQADSQMRLHSTFNSLADVNRVLYLEAGNLNHLLKQCSGTIVVNSTVGTSALSVNCPVIALGSAIYAIEGLTFQGPLDDFWMNATPPNKALFEAFRRCYISATQINGSFYNQKGITMAVNASIPKLLNSA